MTPLRQRMIEDMCIRNLAPRTQTAYVEHVHRFARYFRKSPDQLGPAEIRAWLIHLTQDKHLSASSISVTVAALRFFYVVTLIRRFLIHVLPDGFHRIRYYGFLGNGHRARKLAVCRELFGMVPIAPVDPPVDFRDRFEALTGRSLRQCPHCQIGTMVVIACLPQPTVCLPGPDTS